MSTFGKVDPSTLGWVKGEIDETLKQARLALESFAENPSDKTRLRFCITHLHQVVGTLLMVELDGAAMLAREAEQLAESVLNDDVKSSQAVLEALTGAIITLPDYLARLQFGQTDAPARHLPLINEMRAARGVEQISEFELFAPDLGVRPPAEARAKSPLEDNDYRNLARGLRTSLQSTLLRWLRDVSDTAALSDIGAIFNQLRDQTGFAPHEQMFWVAGGLVEALIDGLEPTPDRKKLFARLDQQIKRLLDSAEKSDQRKNAELVTRAMLWEIARSRSQGHWTTQLKQAFSLDALISAENRGPTFEMPAPEVLASVTRALGTEVSTAQDLLTTYFDPSSSDPKVLDQLQEQLTMMSSTLEMLGVPPLQQLVNEISEVCRALGNRQLPDPDAVAMPLAEALLLLESGTRDIRAPFEWSRSIEDGMARLRALHGGGTNSTGIEVQETELTEVEFKQLLGVVAHEVGANLGKIEEAIESFAADTTRREAIREVPGLLSQIQGAMQILGQERASTLVENTRGYVEHMANGTLAVTPAIMDALAVCIGTIGAYMEGLHADRRNLEALIEGAESEMSAALESGGGILLQPAPSARPASAQPRNQSGGLTDTLESFFNDPHNDATLANLRAMLEDRARSANALGEERIGRIADETLRLIQLVVEDDSRFTPEVVETLRHSVAALASAPAARAIAPAQSEPELEFETETATPASPVFVAPPKPAPMNIEVDDEIREIFIEDARDVLSTMTRYFAVWRENKENKEALAELRRGFHTLKGSGRMVNATDIAEFAWGVECLLNRVRDGKIPCTSEVVSLVGQAQDVLPGMVNHYAGGPAPTFDVEPLRVRAHELAQSGASSAPAPEKPAPVNRSADLPRLDGTLRDIFSNEAHGHLENMRHEINAGRNEGARLVSEMLFRSAHTLAGNARSLGIDMMSETCHETEKMLQHMRAHSLPLRDAELSLLERLHTAVTELVDLLNRGTQSAGDLARQFGAIAREARAATPAGQEHAPAPALKRAEPAMVWNEPAPRAEAPRAPMPIATAKPTTVAPAIEIDAELLEIFQEEAAEILEVVDSSLARLRSNADDRPALADFKRGLHTLKGGGRMAGIMVIGDLAHVTEGFLKRIEDGQAKFNGETFSVFDEAHDLFIGMLDALDEGKPLPSPDELYGKIAQLAPDLPLPESAAQPSAVAHDAPVADYIAPTESVLSVDVPTLRSVAAVEADETSMAPEQETPLADMREVGEDETRAGAFPEKMDRRGQIKVRTQLLNELVNYAGEVSISRSRMEQQIHSFRDNMGELSRNVIRFREQIRELEIQSESQILYRTEQTTEGRPDIDFDPLEFDRFSRLQQLSRQLAESLHDLSTIQNNLGTFVGEAETVLQQQARLNTDLQEGLMRTRMVSFDTIAARLRHIARTTARELGKSADLELTGTEVEVDRTVLERMISPFEHMIRNSLDHGIEMPDVRRQRGKVAMGRIAISCTQEGSEIVIRFTDDGAGLNIDAIRNKAIERGMLAADMQLTDEELIQFILMPGFSTAAKVTHVSGRGVGMDVVHNEVKQLGGTMSVVTERDAGAAFVVRLPLTLSITQALMTYIGDQTFAVPLGSVANIVEFPVDKLNELAMGKNPLLEWNGQVYPYMHLGRRLHIESIPRNAKKVPVLLARAGSREVAIQVDGLGGTREVVIKSIGAQLSIMKGLAGATILGDGRVILILDVPGLWFRDETLHIEGIHVPTSAVARPAAPKAPERPVVMVVDDSLTVRKVTGKHLQKRGMEVLTAKDGVDAVEQLRDRVPDIMLVDIEMPRMDGYELTQRVRSEERLAHVPIIMITSRAGAKHRQKAIELGVDMYMSKPYQEDELFKNIDALLKSGRIS